MDGLMNLVLRRGDLVSWRSPYGRVTGRIARYLPADNQYDVQLSHSDLYVKKLPSELTKEEDE